MKNAKLSVAAVAALTLGAGACDDGLADINENPNAPTNVPAQYILPAALQGTVEQIYGGWFNLEFAGLFAQHWAKIQYNEEDQFQLRPAVIDGFWINFYTGGAANGVPVGGLSDWKLVIEKGMETGAVNHEATGRVMKAFTGQVMTDVWGDIPWSEALRGGDAGDPILTPAYDTQEEIYDALVAELDAALALFDPAERTWGPEDLIYGGDIAAWSRFANSLKLRMAMRISDVDATTAQQWVSEVLASSAGLITENSQNARLAFLEAAPNQNPLYENWFGGRDDHAVSETLVDLMLALNDPRLPVYATPAQSDGEYRGAPNGVLAADIPALPTISRIGEHWRSDDNTAAAATPAYLLTAAEVHFLLAEAALNGWTTPMTAQQHYEAGVTASLQMWNGANGTAITAADIATYLAEPGVAWGTGDSDLEQVIEQKWLALYTNGPEAYAEYRRTGYPDEITIHNGHTLAYVPGRIPYPDREQSLNRDMWQAALTAQGIDGTYTGRVWWDPVAPGS